VSRSQYIAQQVATLLKFAEVTADLNVTAALVDKAAELKDRVDQLPSRSHRARPEIDPKLRN
jgi:hypothetical protein